MRKALPSSSSSSSQEYVCADCWRRWDHTTSIPEIMDSLHILVEQGKVLYLGISDTPAWIVSAANEYAKSHGKTQFSIYQGRWNVMLRDMERDIVPMCKHYGMAIAPWDAIGGGKFQSKKAMDERKKNNEGLRSLMGSGEQTEQEIKMSEALGKVAGEHGIESVTAVALAWIMTKSVSFFKVQESFTHSADHRYSRTYSPSLEAGKSSTFKTISRLLSSSSPRSKLNTWRVSTPSSQGSRTTSSATTLTMAAKAASSSRVQRPWLTCKAKDRLVRSRT